MTDREVEKILWPIINHKVFLWSIKNLPIELMPSTPQNIQFTTLPGAIANCHHKATLWAVAAKLSGPTRQGRL
jgi:hypothetical protein